MGWLDRLIAVRRRFTGRLLLGLLLIHAVLLPALFGGVLYLVKRAHETQFVEHVRADAYLLATLAGELGEGRLRALLEEAVLAGRVVFASLIDASENDVFTVPETEAARPFLEDFYFGHHGDGVYHIELPLLVEDRPTGARLRLGYDETPTRVQVQRAWRRGIGFAAGYVLLTLSMVLFWGRRLSRPLDRLRQSSRRIAAGDFEASMDVRSELEEVRGLAADLDYMRRELVSQAQRLERLAMHDPLTGLSNRALFQDRLKQAVHAARRRPAPFALMLIDLDRFKEINDTLGHVAGDELLRQAAARLTGLLRETDTVARLGGDEFALLLPTLGRAHAPRLARKMIEALCAPYRLDGQTVEVGASVGIALFPDHGREGGELMRHADVAMYIAKWERCGAAVYDPARDRSSLRRLTLTAELREAIARGDLIVHYQPQVALADGRVIGVEALVRWRHRTCGLISAEEFIAAAEHGGLIARLTEKVLEIATADWRRLRGAGLSLRLSVNLSAYSLHEDETPRAFAEIIRRSALPAQALVLELTESALFNNPAQRLERLRYFTDLGVRLSIDDFGSGYSSLAHLQGLAVCELKIGRGFVTDVARNANNAAIVRGAVKLAHSLGLTVVAEGVEEAPTLQRLRALGCDKVQGNYISPPLPIEALAQWVRGWRAADFLRR